MRLPSNVLLLYPLCSILLQATGYPAQHASNSPSRSPKLSLAHPAHPFDEKTEIRSARLENRFAKKRLGQYKQEQSKYDFAVEEAANVGIHAGYSHQQSWVKEHLKHVDAKKNVSMHQLASKIINNHYPNFSDITHAFDERLEVLEKNASHHKNNRDAIKKVGGTFGNDEQEEQIAADMKRAKENYNKRMVCQHIIDKNNAYLKQFEKSKCTIM